MKKKCGVNKVKCRTWKCTKKFRIVSKFITSTFAVYASISLSSFSLFVPNSSARLSLDLACFVKMEYHLQVLYFPQGCQWGRFLDWIKSQVQHFEHRKHVPSQLLTPSRSSAVSCILKDMRNIQDLTFRCLTCIVKICFTCIT